MIIAGLVIVIEDGGPPFHRRLSLGRDGRPFQAIKFRTMRVDAERWLENNLQYQSQYAENVKLRLDPRVTKVGRVLRKTSIDELPELLNVLANHMSLVGPRPIHPSEAPRYGGFLEERQTVKPGITGWWQVAGRQNVDYQTRIALDREYLTRRSLLFDLKILVMTIPVVLKGEGAV